MPINDLVRVRLEGVEVNVGRSYAIAKGLEILDESVRNRDGSLRDATRTNGRPVKQKTTVTEQVAAKKAVIEPAPTKKEHNR